MALLNGAGYHKRFFRKIPTYSAMDQQRHTSHRERFDNMDDRFWAQLYETLTEYLLPHPV